MSKWKKFAEKEGPGDAEDALFRKAIQLNPALKGGDKTDDVIARMQAQKKAAKAEKKKAEPEPKRGEVLQAPGKSTSIAGGLAEIKRWYIAEEGRMADEQAAAVKRQETLADEEKAHLAAQRQELTDALARLDPTLASPMTNEVLGLQAKFLARIGTSKDQLQKTLRGKA
jgi:chromatin segregation and condensation protein Rec8/ScpA/Scc1 (kleisin family)